MLDKADLVMILKGSWAEVAEEFGVTVVEYAEFFIKRFEPLLQDGRAYFTKAGRYLDSGNLAAIIDIARRSGKQNNDIAY